MHCCNGARKNEQGVHGASVRPCTAATELERTNKECTGQALDYALLQRSSKERTRRARGKRCTTHCCNGVRKNEQGVHGASVRLCSAATELERTNKECTGPSVRLCIA